MIITQGYVLDRIVCVKLLYDWQRSRSFYTIVITNTWVMCCFTTLLWLWHGEMTGISLLHDILMGPPRHMPSVIDLRVTMWGMMVPVTGLGLTTPELVLSFMWLREEAAAVISKCLKGVSSQGSRSLRRHLGPSRVQRPALAWWFGVSTKAEFLFKFTFYCGRLYIT